MKPERNILRTLLLLSVLAVTFLMACEKESANATDDPIIGNWKLKTVITNGETVDVSNRECFKDSYFNVTTKEMKLSTSAPKQGGGCEKEEGTAKWENVNGKYWEVSGSDRTLLDITLLENNTVLRLNATNNGNPIQMFYAK